MSKSGATCRHRWRITAYVSNGMLYEHCARCGTGQERTSTPKEARDYRAWRKTNDARLKALHRPYHSFSAAIGDLHGYEAMKAAERWVAKHPSRASIVRVDDDVHANSCVVLIAHEDPVSRPESVGARPEPGWFGISAVHIPQCTGGKPVHFFLYPWHLQGLFEALRTMRARMLSYPEPRRELAAIRRRKRAT